MCLSSQVFFVQPPKMGKCPPLIYRRTSFCPQLEHFHFFYSCMTCCWSHLLEITKQTLSVPFCKLQNFNYLYSANNHLLNPSLVLKMKYSVPIPFLLLDEPYNMSGKKAHLSGKIQEIVREIHLPNLVDTLNEAVAICLGL